jgi:parallel beta-helix repeat protein
MIVNKKLALASAFSMVLLISMAVEVQLVNLAAADPFFPPPPEHIYIRSDGSVVPSTAPISRVGSVYTLTGNITEHVIEVQRDNIVIDGAGYALEGIGGFYAGERGIALTGRGNVTVKNMEIKKFGYGIYLSNSSNNIITENKITDNLYGIWIADQSTNNVISRNNVTETWYTGCAISIHYSGDNTFRNNVMYNNDRFNFWVESDDASSLLDFVNDVDASNMVDGKPICYWINQHDRIVPSNVGYVALISCAGITVQNLNLTRNWQGVLLISTTNSMVTENNITGNNQGVCLALGSQDNAITENNITNNVYGIAAYSSNNVFRNNRLDNNEYVANFESGFVNDIDNSNTVESAPICYWVNQYDKTVPSDVGYVVLNNCSGITVQNLNITGQKQGLLLISTRDCVITKNTIANSEVGIYIKDSSSNKITGNQVINNSETGIYLESSHYNTVSENKLVADNIYGIRATDSTNNAFTGNHVTDSIGTGVYLIGASSNTVSGNTLANNSWGIRMIESSGSNIVSGNNVTNNDFGISIVDSRFNKIVENNIAENRQLSIELRGTQGNNTICHNNFINNNETGFGVSNPWPCNANVWDDGEKGNYWSDYKTRYPNASEVDNSGVGDTPYFINVNNIDRYPLMAPYEIILPTDTAPSSQMTLIASAIATLAISVAAFLVYFTRVKKTSNRT